MALVLLDSIVVSVLQQALHIAQKKKQRKKEIETRSPRS